MLQRSYVKRTFDGERFEGSIVLCDARFDHCSFDHCHVIGVAPDARPVLERIVLANCSISQRAYSTVGNVVIRDVEIINLKSRGMTQLWNCVFDRVVLRGRFDAIMIGLRWTMPMDAAIAAVVAKEQQSVDWAVDISQAEFRDINFDDIPASLVKRDPETQAVIRRDRLIASGWNPAEAPNTLATIVMGDLLKSAASDALLIAPKRDKKYFAQVMESIRQLRAEGIAESD